jgi:phosphatidylglycerol lysyltransferase
LALAVRRWGYSCFAFDTLQRPDLYETFPSTTTPGALVAYRRIGPVDVILGEPLAPRASLGAVVEEFLRERRSAGRLVLGFLASRDFALAAVSAGASAVEIAAEPEVDPVTYEPHGSSAKKFRVYVRRMQRSGIEAIALPARTREVPALFRLSADLLIRNWLAYGVSRGAHLLDIEPWRSSEEKRYFAVYDPKSGTHLWALVIAHPVYALDGWHLCHLVRSPDAPEGALELAVMRAIEAFRRERVRYLTLGPYADVRAGEFLNVGPVARWLFDRAYGLTARLGGHAKAREFFHKVQPGPWQPRYLVFYPRRAYLRTLRAAMQVSHVIE